MARSCTTFYNRFAADEPGINAKMADHEASAERPAKRIRLSTDDLKDEQLQRELRFGIASFVNEGAPTFSGILKQR